MARKAKVKVKAKAATKGSYSPEFKASAVARLAGGETLAGLSKQIGVSQVSLASWRNIAKGRARGPHAAARSGKVNGHGASVPSTFTTLVRAAQDEAKQAHDATLLLTLRTWLRDGWRWVEAKQASGEFDNRSEPDRGHLMLQLALSEIEKATQGRRK